MRERNWWRETKAHSTRERKKKKNNNKKTLASCYSRVSKMTLHCSKDVKKFMDSMLDVDETLRGWELKLGFSIFHIFDVKRQLQNTIDHCIHNFTSVVRKYKLNIHSKTKL